MVDVNGWNVQIIKNFLFLLNVSKQRGSFWIIISFLIIFSE